MYTILIIEDDRDMAQAMQRLLEKWGYRTTVICEAFDRIWETFQAAEPHFVLLDMNIPTYDGFYLKSTGMGLYYAKKWQIGCASASK